MASNLSGILSGVAGEYFVAAELSRRGYIASLTLKNTAGIDVLVSDYAGRSIRIQVKTNQGVAKKWVLSKSAENEADPGLFYVLVNLNGLGEPSYHVVSSLIVSRTIKEGHARWLEGSKKDGSARKDTDMRTFSDRDNEFRDAWDALGLTPA